MGREQDLASKPESCYLNKILFEPRDRVIPDPSNYDSTRAFVKNEAYDYKIGDPNLEGSIIGTTALCTRYKSKTFEDYIGYITATGRNRDGSRIAATQPA